jgi:hypothetical protein
LQCFIPWIEKYPKEDAKVFIGDNLSAHMSPYVTDKCEEFNIRLVLDLS